MSDSGQTSETHKFRRFEPKTLLLKLRKHAYSNILKITSPKPESFQIQILIFFIILLKNIDCGYSLEPPRPKTKIVDIS